MENCAVERRALERSTEGEREECARLEDVPRQRRRLDAERGGELCEGGFAADVSPGCCFTTAESAFNWALPIRGETRVPSSSTPANAQEARPPMSMGPRRNK